MKRYLILLGALLIGLALRAQSVTYSCRYWFDQNHAQVVTASFSDSTWQAEFDVGSLSEGIHQLHLQIADTANNWSPPQNYFFIKLADTLKSDWTCHYWFDQNHQQMQHHPFGNGHLLLEVADLEDGMHTMSFVLESEKLTAVQNYTFVKVATIGLDTLNMSNLVYHCWFDQDFEHRQTDYVGDGHFLLDVAELSYGLHTINVLLEGDALTSTSSYSFMKVPVQDPASPAQYQCWFDDDYSTMQTGLLGTGCFQLDVDVVPKGFHTVNVQVNNNGLLSAPQTYLFYRQPLGGFGLARWEYWLNDCQSRKQTTDIVPSLDTLDIMALLPVEAWPIRSTCFHFHPNGDEPFINAKNKISFRFWNTDDRFIEQSAYYVDENVSEPIVADSLERNTTISIAAPRDNQIQWFRLAGNRGDIMAFQADRACTMQLFAPSGEEVYSASGPESIHEVGFNVWENGAYYLAVHDANGSEDTVSITYNWVYRYNIASYDVHLVGNGGCSTITVQGNGFNSLLDVYLVNWQNDTIRSLDIGHESNTTTTVSFNFYQENLGTYDAVFEFFEETIRINGALEVQEPADILLTSSVSYPSRFLRNTPCTYTYTITNNGNMSAYAVPIFVYIASPTIDGISHLELDGFGLSSILDGIELDSLSQNVILDLKAWAKDLGDDHCFYKTVGFDETTGDTVIVRSNFFFLNLAPYETRTLTFKITSSEDVTVWMTVPSDTIRPVDFQESRYSLAEFCCVADKISCGVNIVCTVSDLIAPMLGPWMTVLACACDLFSVAFTEVSTILCVGPTVDYAGFWDQLAMMSAMHSLLKVFVGCMIKSGFLGIFNFTKYKETIEMIVNALTNLTLTENSLGCIHAFAESKPNCPPGEHKGGNSGAVNGFDPNDIYGYLSESGSHYMRQEIQNVQYEIEFENDTALATAAAHTIIVRDTLDATKFDLNSLAARSVTIGDKRLDLNGEQTFARTLDLRPENYVIAQINQDYDPTTGVIQWTIQSLDPMTMEPTNDPNQGVLPVNYYGDGVGFIDYSVNLKQAFADGAEISNRAGIIFDQEDQILTPTWTNIVDAVKPTSHIEEVTLMGDSVSFSFVSSDNRSGVWYHSLYYRNASTEQEWLVKKAQIFEDSFMLPFDSLQTTEYFVIAVDSAGNVEAMKTEAEVVVESSASGFPFFVAGYGESTNAGWKLIASPIAGSIAATTVDNIFAATQYDLYYFNQGEETEWRNYKSVPFELVNGQGYLYATKEEQTLVFRGAYNNAETQEVSLVYTEDNPVVTMRGWNLIGNPFTMPAYVDRSYYTMNEDGTAIEPNAASSTTAIPACNGVMVKAEAQGETVTFSRAIQQNATNQGCLQIAVAEANTRGNIAQDKAIVSFNAGDRLNKFFFNESKAKLYIPQDGKDLAIAFADEVGEIPVNFKATKNGTYTINVDVEGVDFYYLHLIDNLTGDDVDLLVDPNYIFEAKTTDYASRFRLVFFACGDADDDNAPFAFVNNGNIIIVGAEDGATLQIVDVLGRVLVSGDASNVPAISTRGMPPGVYVLRLIEGEKGRTQKIVID